VVNAQLGCFIDIQEAFFYTLPIQKELYEELITRRKRDMKTVKRYFSTLVFAAVVTAIPCSQAFPQGSWPCAEDTKRLCSNVQPGEGRIAKCLKQHKDELSPGCKEFFQKAGTKNKAKTKIKKVCAEDIKNLCKEIKPGGGRIRECLNSHVKQLAPDCRKALKTKKHKKK
jgi:hypothetical protein